MEVEGMRRNEAIISFGPEDLKGVNLPYNDALVIQARVANYDIMRVFVDSGSSVNVIFKEALLQMDLQGYQMETVETALFGFAGHTIYQEGEIILPLTLGTMELKKTVMNTFTVVDAPSSYNIKGRSIHISSEDKIPSGESNQKKARREKKRISGDEEAERVVEEGEVHFVAEEDREVVEIEPGREIRVAQNLDLSTLVSLLNCIKSKVNIFARSQQELIGISPLIAEHYLNILPGYQPVKQKKRHFDPENDKGYHQIPLARNDQDKASFITSGGTFCYVVMPFGLKNAMATYQRLMNKVFDRQLGKNVEVYINDILGNSREISCFIADLEEIFATLMHYGIKSIQLSAYLA
ncbi:uncharacterized protein LOC142525822 [Primulina tabacum]|uniref:uncharacterized protein LOC142525822 n=1 Tax=Primulina tabacum TaxID=48773 RepID=UPI003F599968